MRIQPFSIPVTTAHGIVLDTVESAPWIYMAGVIPYDALDGDIINTDIWEVVGAATQGNNKIHITGPATPGYDAAGIAHKATRTSGYYIGQVSPGSSKIFIGLQDYGEASLVFDSSVGIELSPGKAMPYLNGSAYTPIAFAWVADNPMVYSIVMGPETIIVRIFTANLAHELIMVQYTFLVPAPTAGWKFVINIYESDNTVDFWRLANAFRDAIYSGSYITPSASTETVYAAGLESQQYRNMIVGIAGSATAEIDDTDNLIVLPINGAGVTSSNEFTGKKFYPMALTLIGDVINVGPVWVDVG